MLKKEELMRMFLQTKPDETASKMDVGAWTTKRAELEALTDIRDQLVLLVEVLKSKK